MLGNHATLLKLVYWHPANPDKTPDALQIQKIFLVHATALKPFVRRSMPTRFQLFIVAQELKKHGIKEPLPK